MIIAVPADTAETTPETEPTVATPILQLLHKQPESESVSEAVPPTHIVVVPTIGGKVDITVTVVVVLHRPQE